MRLGSKKVFEEKEILKELTEKPKVTQEQKDLLIEAHKSASLIVEKRKIFK